ncbi:MAG: magnesium/cobalt transporter CorA [Bacteroidetes bacterium]|nr:magnesium/cobalt transporter CorA [Bacteroidota bacterium]MBK8659163.1 magnesium/cobalt transporter CorA [Bacteroidota bacterium]
MPTSNKSKIYFYRYNKDECFYDEHASLQECAKQNTHTHVNWINILGIEDKELLQQTAGLFDIHPLVMEDIQNPNQRAKIEDYNDSLYLVLRMFALVNDEIVDQQVSMVLRDNFLLTFREADFSVFKKNIGDKLLNNTGALRKKGEDYLLYYLLDVIIDNYFFVIESVEERVERLEQEIFRNPHDGQLVTLQRLKSDVMYMRKNIVPVRDLITNLIRNEIEYFEADNKYYLRDLQDHMTRNVEELDFLSDQLNSLMDLYYSLQTHKMNNVMKTLTSVSFVLLPLTFIASLYGMNFVNIPRANDPWGFWEVVVGMLVFALLLSTFAIRRKWFSVKDFRSQK